LAHGLRALHRHLPAGRRHRHPVAHLVRQDGRDHRPAIHRGEPQRLRRQRRHGAIARAAPDGNTVGLGSVAPLSIAPTLYGNLPFSPVRDFTYISGLWQLPNLLVVNNDVPARTVPELIALLKENPGKYAYASSGSGTTVHLSARCSRAWRGSTCCTCPTAAARPRTSTCWPGAST
jgi:hypothetical protein